jgi:hypothetical protein
MKEAEKIKKKDKKLARVLKRILIILIILVSIPFLLRYFLYLAYDLVVGTHYIINRGTVEIYTSSQIWDEFDIQNAIGQNYTIFIQNIEMSDFQFERKYCIYDLEDLNIIDELIIFGPHNRYEGVVIAINAKKTNSNIEIFNIGQLTDSTMNVYLDCLPPGFEKTLFGF